MLSKSVQSVFREALMEAQIRRHEIFTVEHLLYALCKSGTGQNILANCGASIDELRKNLEDFFQTEIAQISLNRSAEYIQTEGFKRVIDRAFALVKAQQRRVVEMGDLLLAIIDEKDSYACYFLRRQGIDRQKIFNFLSRNSFSDSRSCERCDEESGSKGDPLAEFTIDLTAKAKEGKIDPLIGREKELDRTIEVLCRRRKNNPLFVGDPGVGKTAMAEGLALRIAQGNVPEIFKDTHIYSLDMGSAVAGTRYRGDFEQRLKGIVEALKKDPKSILFIDEIHTLVGAGATSGGTMDASNLLKPALANGEIRCIGSTTYEEFRNHLEKDRALARRFQKIDLSEPNNDDCIAILKGIENHYAKHHEVQYSPAILKAIVELSTRHVRDRQQPDKAIDVLDECGAAVHLSMLNSQRNDAHVLMGDVERIIARMAGIPARTVSGKERDKLQTLQKDLKKVVYGQDEAIDITVKAILRARAGLTAEKRPAGSFLFYGPTGVGKTEVAKSLANIMGIEFLRYDMSEYMEKHAVARLIGSPPGYVGFEQGGLLTEAVRKAPYSVVLFDEIEKAHPDIFNILLQVMDYGTLTDNTGRKTDFSNVIIIMTSNAGAFEMSKSSIGFNQSKNVDAAEKGLKAVENMFSPEFRNRLDALVPFHSLDQSMMLNIVDKFLNPILANLRARKVNLTVTEEAREWFAKKGFDPAMGARPLRRLIRTELEDKLATDLLFGNLKKGGKAELSIEDDHVKLNYINNNPSKTVKTQTPVLAD